MQESRTETRNGCHTGMTLLHNFKLHVLYYVQHTLCTGKVHTWPCRHGCSSISRFFSQFSLLTACSTSQSAAAVRRGQWVSALCGRWEALPPLIRRVPAGVVEAEFSDRRRINLNLITQPPRPEQSSAALCLSVCPWYVLHSNRMALLFLSPKKVECC